MQAILSILTLYMFSKCHSVTINGGSNDPDITVELTEDPRGLNEITNDNFWKMRQTSKSSSLHDWALSMTLDSHEYGFQSGQESKLVIEMAGYPGTDESDGFFAFSVGDEYFTFTVDFDGGLWVIKNGDTGIFIYPSCGTSSFPSGDASQLFSESASLGTSFWYALRDDLAGGDAANWERLTATQNDENFPVIFEFINDDVDDTFTFRFISDTFPSGLECVYDSAMATEEDFKFYLSPDAGTETLYVTSFEVHGEYLGTDCGFCGAAASAYGKPSGNEYWNNYEYNYDDKEPLNVRTIIWSGAISIILAVMAVCVSHSVCMNYKAKTRGYGKVDKYMDSDYASS